MRTVYPFYIGGGGVGGGPGGEGGISDDSETSDGSTDSMFSMTEEAPDLLDWIPTPSFILSFTEVVIIGIGGGGKYDCEIEEALLLALTEDDRDGGIVACFSDITETLELKLLLDNSTVLSTSGGCAGPATPETEVDDSLIFPCELLEI